MPIKTEKAFAEKEFVEVRDTCRTAAGRRLSG
jgi:hypothetical protein